MTKPRFLIRDVDRKFPDSLKDFWKAEGVRTIRIPPRANAFAEIFGATLKRECLNFFLCFSLHQPHYITQTWIRHYNNQRPHRSVSTNNHVLDEQFKPQRDGPVRCRERLGELIKDYYREAA